MKRKAILMFAALSVALGAAAGSRMATEEWVRRYVGTAGTNGVFATEAWVSNYVADALADVGVVSQTSASNGQWLAYGKYRVFVEDQTEFCIAVMEETPLSASHGFTNDCVFARVPDESRYRHGPLSIYETPTNFYTVAGGNTYVSVDIGSGRWLADIGGGETNLFCHLCGTYLSPTQAADILSIPESIGGAE
ncbi:MAG: hypothetical protein IJR99_12345 [Kiritimatiellae bacterium]|nr:hypothetical protein [Kiritimatiellia bacterium]